MIITDSPVVPKNLLDVFYPRWSLFSVDYQVTMTTSWGEAKRLVSRDYNLISVDYDLPDDISSGEVLRHAFRSTRLALGL